MAPPSRWRSRLRGVVKTFGNDAAGQRVAKATGTAPGEVISAVAGIDLDIYDGEFFSMLGPSGSGKTTTLRMIAGFELPTAGQILLHGEDVSSKPPFDRDVNTVFQDYALFPHMTVEDNVAYGLVVRKVPKGQRTTQVTDALRMVRLRRLRGPQARPAVWRPTPACGPGARPGQPAACAPAGRTARRAWISSCAKRCRSSSRPSSSRSGSPSST